MIKKRKKKDLLIKKDISPDDLTYILIISNRILHAIQDQQIDFCFALNALHIAMIKLSKEARLTKREFSKSFSTVTNNIYDAF